jgi:hypothetical protein
VLVPCVGHQMIGNLAGPGQNRHDGILTQLRRRTREID